MKKIVFLNLQKNNWLVFLVILMLVLLATSFVFWQNTYLRISLYLLIVIYFSKNFWFRNYFEWNKRGFLIKINSFFGTTYLAADVQQIVFMSESLKIIRNNGKEKTFCLKHIAAESKQRLFEILQSYKEGTFVTAQ